MRSILARLVIMSVTTAVLTTSLSAGILHPQSNVGETTNISASTVLKDVTQAWQLGDPINSYGPSSFDNIRGYIVDSSGKIRYTYGTTPCTNGMDITLCYHNLSLLKPTGHTQRHLDDHLTWTDAKQALTSGGWVVVSYHNLSTAASASFWSNSIVQIGFIALLAFPLSFLLSFVTARPLARRLKKITHASSTLAHGNLDVRTGETADDEIGLLGANFDQMANVMNQQVVELRSLAEKNSSLLLVVEKVARATERTLLSRDLHDSISQHLFSLAMGTSNLATLISRDPIHAAQNAEQLALIANRAQDELRAVLNNLRLSPLNRGSLTDALSEWIASWQAQYAITVSMQFYVGNHSLPFLIEDALFHACQEGLNNIARHSHASQADIVIKQDRNSVLLELSDNGQGFEPEATTSGLGLIGLSERVRALGGTLRIMSKTGVGTQVHIQVPLAEVSTGGEQ